MTSDYMQFRRHKFFSIFFSFLVSILFLSIRPGQAGQLDSLQIVPDPATAGDFAVYQISFINTQSILSQGKIVVILPPDYNVSRVYATSSADPNGLDGGFLQPVIQNDQTTFAHTIICQRDNTGNTVNPGTKVTINISMIGNPESPSLLDSVEVKTYDNVDINKNAALDSATAFVNITGPISSFTLQTPTNVVAGAPFDLIVTNAKDYRDSLADGVVSIEAIQGGGNAPDGTQPIFNDIVVTNGTGSAQQTLYLAETNVRLKGTDQNGATSTTNAFDVAAAGADSLSLTGEPSSVQAGAAFANDMTVTAYDAYGNIATGYNGSVYFTSTDAQAALPYTAISKYTFDPATDLGTHSFPGSGFALKTAGGQLIGVTDDVHSDTTDTITVSSAAVASFDISISTPVTAGQPATITVQNAKDAYGNLVDCIVSLAYSDGGAHLAPDGTQPVLPDVHVVNGTGSVTASLYKSESGVAIRGSSGGKSNTTAAFDVMPGDLYAFDLQGVPTSVIAGDDFGANSVTVTARDAYGNTKTNYGGTVWFTSTDAAAVLTYNNPASGYQFQSGDAGSHVFPGSDFTLNTAGQQKITVTDATISKASDYIAVQTANIANFDVSVSKANPQAGESFNVIVSNAIDGSGNPTSGIVAISFNDGQAHIAPDGSTKPILSHVEVSNGTGQAAQTLYLAESNVVLKAVNGSVEKQTPAITVSPGNLAALTMTGYPQTTTAGENFGSHDITVTVLDAWENVITNFTGTVYFSSTDNLAVLPYTNQNPYQFNGSENGVKVFPGTDFELRKSGQQTIAAHSGTIAETSSHIYVQPGTISSFDLNVLTVQTAGVQFDLQVTNAVDQYGNAADGTIEVSAVTGGSNAPNGQPPIFNNIPVSNGAGTAAQTLVKAETGVVLQGKVSGTSITKDTPGIKVNPGALSMFTLTGYPANVKSGTPFPSDVTVSAYDGFANPKTDYNGTVSFNSSDVSATLPSDYTFQGTYQHVFPNYNFVLNTPGAQTIGVMDASAGVSTTSDPIDVSSIFIERIVSDATAVSRGQNNVVVQMVVQNNGNLPYTNVQAQLKFWDSQNNVVDTDYRVVRTDAVTSIPGNSTATLQFDVDVAETATLDSIKIDGLVTGTFNSVYVEEEGAAKTHKWQVQLPATVTTTLIQVAEDTVDQGQSGIFVRTVIDNRSNETSPIADANIILPNLMFQFQDGSDYSSYFTVAPSTDNPSMVAGADTTTLKYYFSVSENAPPGIYQVFHTVIFSDKNTGTTSLSKSPLFDTFVLRESSIVELENITPSQNTVTSGQDSIWTVRMGIKNAGGSPLTLSFDPSKTYIRFKKGVTDYTDQFLVDTPTEFEEGGTSLQPNEIKHVVFVIRHVASLTGQFTIQGRAEATNGFYDTSLQRDVWGLIELQAPDDVRILPILTSQPTATINDTTRKWKIYVPLFNQGGSTVSLSLDSTHLVLSDTAGFILQSPDSLENGGHQLSGGEGDTLVYTVLRTGSKAGSVTIGADVHFQVLNTHERKHVVASQDSKATVHLQSPSDFHITAVRVSQRYVTSGVTPNWWVTVALSNENGGADVKVNLDSPESTWVKLYQNSLPQQDYLFALPDKLEGSGTQILAAGSKDSLIFPVSQMGAEIGEFVVVANVKATEINRGLAISRFSLAEGHSDTVTVQTRANINYVTRSLFPATVSPQSSVEFQVNVENSGESTLQLNPEQTTFHFTDGVRSFTAALDPSFITSVPGNSTATLHFRKQLIPKSFLLGTYNPILTLAGAENGNSYSKQIILPDPVIVSEPSELAINFVAASVPSITAGQTVPWLIHIGLSSNGPSSLHLDSSRVTFFYGSTDVSSFFSIDLPDTLLHGRYYLRNNSADTLRVSVNSVSPTIPVGPVTIFAQVWMTDSLQASRQLVAQTNQGNAGTVVVQSPADLQVKKLAASQDFVTRGQDVPWTINVHVQNNGGSDLLLNSDTTRTFLLFTKGNDRFHVLTPTAFAGSGNNVLAANSSDSLIFTVDRVDSSRTMLGLCSIFATISMTELNTHREIDVSTQALGIKADVTIQDSALVRIDGLFADVPMDTFVNRGQNYYLRARVSNPGTGDDVKQVKLQFYSQQGLSTFPQGDTITVVSIPAGQSKVTEPGVLVHATDALVRETFHVRVVESKARNTLQPVRVLSSIAPADTTVYMNVQSPGHLIVHSVTTSIDTIPSGTLTPWFINVAIANEGQARLLLKEPQASDILVNKPGYVIVPDTVLSEDGLLLTSGDTDTLVYRVVTTSPASGTVTITARVSATDGNDSTKVYQETGQTTIFVTTTAAVLISRTFADPDSFNVDKDGVVHVNVNQPFKVKVRVKNDGGQDIDSVRVRLSAAPSRVLEPDEQVIRSLKTGRTKELIFSLVADSMENLDGEVISADIVHAYGIDGSKADVINALDSTVVVKIYRPAKLKIVETLNKAPNPDNFVSFNQTFPVTVAVRNIGSETTKDIQLKLSADPDTLVTISQPLKTFSTLLKGGEIDTFSFDVSSKGIPGRVLFKTEILNAVDLNDGKAPEIETQGIDDSTFAIIQKSAELVIDSVFTSVQEINAGDTRKDWRVNVAVHNSGEADLQFVNVSAENIRFFINGELDDGYQVRPPSGLKGSKNFVLTGGQTDTLIYVISENGKIAGNAQIIVNLSAYDRNKGPESELLHKSGSDSILVISTARVRIVQTSIAEASRDATGAYLLNKGQSFDVNVVVETGERTGADSVIVQLFSDGNTISDPLQATIVHIPADTIFTTLFSLTADETWNNPQGYKIETFQARIVSAKAAASELPAQILPPQTGDDKARARLQLPARLSLSFSLQNPADSILTAGQVFNAVATIANLGTAPTDTGQITFYPPQGYGILRSGEFTTDPVVESFVLPLDVRSAQVSVTLKAPETTSYSDTIKAIMSHFPIDLNSKQSAIIENDQAGVTVTTLSSQLYIEQFSISSPEGAGDGVISTLQDFFVTGQIISSANLRNLLASISIPEGYVLLTNRQVVLTDSLKRDNFYQPVWKLRAPETAVPYPQDIILQVSGTAVDGVKLAADTIKVYNVVRRAELQLEDLTVSSPEGVMQGDEAIFSVGQKATLRTRIVNNGEARVNGEGTVRLDLFTSGIHLDASETSEKMFVLTNQAAVVEWNIIAPDTVKGAENIRISLTGYPVDENTGLPARVVNSPNELKVSTVERGKVNIVRSFVKEPVGAKDDTVSTEQKFIFSAEINSERIQKGATARIYFQNNLLNATVPTQTVPVGISQIVDWEIKAPEVISTDIAVDSVWIEVDAKDSQSGSPLSAISVKRAIYIQPRTEFWLDPKISSPAGLVDRVSTEQTFSLTAFIRHQGAPYVTSDSFTVEITRPTNAEYALTEDVRQKVADSPTWHLKAPPQEPENLSTFQFTFVDWPRDRNSGKKAVVRSTGAELSLLTVKKAELSLKGYLNAKEMVSEGSVRVGSHFKVEATFENSGVADFEGTYRVAIELPPGYTTANPDTQSTTEKSLTWQVNAPVKVSTGQDTIRLSLVQPPLDQYSKQPATILSDTTFVLVRTEAGIVVARPYKVHAKTALVQGAKNLPVLGLQLRNRDNSTGSRSVLKGIKLSLRNKAGDPVAAQSIFSRITAVRHSDVSVLFAEKNDFEAGNQVLLDFTTLRPDTIYDSRPDSIDILVDIRANAKTLDFSVSIDSASALQVYDAATNFPLIVMDSTLTRVKELNFSSGLAVVFEQNLQKTFCNYPNPFGASRPITNFLYYLKQPSDVTIKIFTLTGEPVRSWTFTKTAHPVQTSAGVHEGDVTWDGTNDRGARVLNGVYLAYISTEYGEKAMTKIVVVK